MTISRIGFEVALACWLAAAGPVWAASKKHSPTPPMIALDFKVTVEDLNPVPADSTAELKGLDPCKAMATTRVNPDGQGRFPKVPQCKVQLRIFITGLNTGIVQVDVGKHKDSPVQIQMKSSGAATVLNP
jgi:hypothetical protein